jgi:hypothetical protein
MADLLYSIYFRWLFRWLGKTIELPVEIVYKIVKNSIAQAQFRQLRLHMRAQLPPITAGNFVRGRDRWPSLTSTTEGDIEYLRYMIEEGRSRSFSYS